MDEKELARRIVDGLDVHQANPMNDVLFKFILANTLMSRCRSSTIKT